MQLLNLDNLNVSIKLEDVESIFTLETLIETFEIKKTFLNSNQN